MPTINITNWDGGQAEDIRTFATNESQESCNFDIFTNPHLLQPYPDSVTETLSTGTLVDFKLADVVEVDLSLYSSSGLIALGEEGAADSTPKFFSKDIQTNLTGDWTPRAISGLAGTVVKGSLVAYKGLAYALQQNSTSLYLIQLTNLTTVTHINTGGGAITATATAKMFVHPEDNILYLVAGSTIAKYDGSTFTTSTTQIPTNFTPTSITNYGTYLVIAGYILNKSITYLWGRDMTINTFQGTLDFGEGRLNIIENLGEILIGVKMNNIAGVNSSSPMVIGNTFTIQIWAGGEVQDIKKISLGSTLYSTLMKVKNKNRLFFAFKNTDCIYTVGKNKSGSWITSKDRYIFNGATVPSSGSSQLLMFDNFTIIEDIMWSGFSSGASTGLFYRTKFTAGSPSTDYTATCSYKTTINPSMPIADRYDDKQLEAVQIAYTGASTGTTVLKYSVDGSAMSTIISDTNTTGEHMTPAYAQNDGTQFLSGKEFQFQIESTGGTKIKEVRYRYKKLNESI